MWALWKKNGKKTPKRPLFREAQRFARYLKTPTSRLGKKPFFCELQNFGITHLAGKKCVKYNKYEIATNCVNQIFYLNAFFFFLLTGATWYYHTIYLVFTYFTSFTDYDDDIFEVISNLQLQGSKLTEKFTNLEEKKKKVELHGVHGVSFFQVCQPDVNNIRCCCREETKIKNKLNIC